MATNYTYLRIVSRKKKNNKGNAEKCVFFFSIFARFGISYFDMRQRFVSTFKRQRDFAFNLFMHAYGKITFENECQRNENVGVNKTTESKRVMYFIILLCLIN